MAYASAESKLILTPEDVVREFKFHGAAASNVGVKVARTGSILSPDLGPDSWKRHGMFNHGTRNHSKPAETLPTLSPL